MTRYCDICNESFEPEKGEQTLICPDCFVQGEAALCVVILFFGFLLMLWVYACMES